MLDELLARARADENVVGVIHSGSRGRNAYFTAASDWDAFVVVRDGRGDYDAGRRGEISRTGDNGEQQLLFRDTEILARQHGHGPTIDGWEPDVTWLRG